jgi:hypothetical protein
MVDLTAIPMSTVSLTAKQFGVQVGISEHALASAQIETVMDHSLRQIMLRVHGFLYGETLLTEARELPFTKTVTTWGHTGKLVAWYAPWFGRRWEATETTVHGSVTVKAEHFSAFPDLPYRSPDWGKPIRMTTTEISH